MTGDLYINNKDAYTTWGVNMGDGFLDALDGFLPMKDYIENDKKKAFQAELQAGAFTLKVPALGSEVYNLVYTGKSISYGLSLGRCFGKISAKFTEPNPTDRE